MHWTYFLFSFTALTLSVIMMFSFAASIKEEIPDLNVSLLSREDDPLSFHRLRPKTTKDRQMQALMKIQKKVRASASHKVHSVPTKEENMQVMMKSSKPGQIRSGKTSDQLTPTIKESQSRGQMIDLNLPPPVEEETTLQRQESIDLNKRLSNSPIIHKNLYPLTPSLGQVSSDTQNIQREASFFEMPNVKPPLKRKLYGTRDEAWKNQIRKTLLLKRLRKKEGSMLVSKEKSMTAPVKKTKAVRGSIEWRKNVGKGVQSFYHGLSSEALEERRRLRKERKSRKLSTRKHHIYGGNS